MTANTDHTALFAADASNAAKDVRCVVWQVRIPSIIDVWTPRVLQTCSASSQYLHSEDRGAFASWMDRGEVKPEMGVSTPSTLSSYETTAVEGPRPLSSW